MGRVGLWVFTSVFFQSGYMYTCRYCSRYHMLQNLCAYYLITCIHHPAPLSAFNISRLFIFHWSLEGNTCLFLVGQKQKPQQQKSPCRLDKESDAICAAFKAHTFRLDSCVSDGSRRCIHLQAAVVKIEAAAQIARIPTNQHAGDCS